MALKIVHLCDVHSAKGEDIPAAYAHNLTVDGGTFAVDLCGPCDAERFLPLVGFLDAFGLLTEGNVDPRPALAENLRQSVAQLQQKPPAAPESPQKPRPATPAPVAAPVPSHSPPAAPETTEELAVKAKLQSQTRERLPIMRALLLESPEGLSLREIQERLQLTEGPAHNVLDLLRETNHAEFIGQKWWAPEHVPEGLRERLAAERAIVRQRNAVPRVCPACAAVSSGSNEWERHTLDKHGVRPAEMLGLTCPIDGEEFSAPQVLGMHGRKEHDAVHTPQLFAMAEELGDSLGIIAAMRARFS